MYSFIDSHLLLNLLKDQLKVSGAFRGILFPLSSSYLLSCERFWRGPWRMLRWTYLPLLQRIDVSDSAEETGVSSGFPNPKVCCRQGSLLVRLDLSVLLGFRFRPEEVLRVIPETLPCRGRFRSSISGRLLCYRCKPWGNEQ